MSLILRWLVSVLVLVYCAVTILLFFYQSRLIFFPTSSIEKTPELFNLPYQDVWVSILNSASKKEYIHGWWIKGEEDDSKVILYLHGNGINIGANLSHAYRFHQQGFSVLLIDYRGYGRSQGRFPNETRVYEDAAFAWNYLTQEQKINPGQIWIYGHSLGGAIAIDLAVKCPQAAGLIVESSFTSIRDIIAHRKHFGIFPVDLILTQRFESIKKVPKLKMPVLFIHGSADTTVPAFMSERLYTAASKPKKLLLVPGAEHNNIAEIAADKYLQTLDSFIQQVKSYQ
ncbi:phospholipase [Calothrix sp. 336/3]|nr:phospholipase [Calothrix sp. 336/3]